jgi:hypothetical protein
MIYKRNPQLCSIRDTYVLVLTNFLLDCLYTHFHLTLQTHFTKYYSGDQIKKTQMSRACRTYWGEEKFVQGFGAKI